MVMTERRLDGARWTSTLFIVFTMALATLLVPTDVAASASGNAAAPTFSTPCFTSAKIQQTGSYTVPATGVITVRVVLYGQNGGGSYTPGGLGSTLVVEVAVTPGQVLQAGRLAGAPGGEGAGTVVLMGGTYVGYPGGNGGDAQYVTTAGSDGCQHPIAVAAGGGGGGNAPRNGVGGNADAGAGATGGGDGGLNWAVDGGGGGGATATGGGFGGAAGHDPGLCHDGNAGSWGGFLTGGNGGNAAGTITWNPCYYPGDGGGGGGAGYYYGGGGGSPYANHAAGGGGGGSSFIDPSATKIAQSAAANTGGDPVIVPVYSTTTTLSASPVSPTYGDSLTMTAHITSTSPTQSVPGGTVEFFDRIVPPDGRGLISISLGTAQVASTGDATLTTASLSAGLHNLQACFLGTANTTDAHRSSCGSYQQGVSAPAQCVAAAPSFTDQPTDATVTYWQYASFHATMSSLPDFVQWQFSSDGGTTWTRAPGDNLIQRDKPTPGSYYTFDSFVPSVSQSGMKVRVVASTCGGTTASNTATLTVNPAPLFIVANDKAMVVGGSVPSLDATYGGVVVHNGDTLSGMSGRLSCTITATLLSTPGTYPITCSGLSSPNYTISYLQGTLTVDMGTQAITVLAGTPPSQPYGTATAPTVTCTSNGFVGSDTFVTPPTGAVYARIIISDGTTTYRKITVNATRPAGNYVTMCTGGDPGRNYTISGYIPGTFTIGPAAPAALKISANSKSYTYGAAPPTLDVAYSGSGSSLVGTLSCSAYAKSDTGYASPIALSDTIPVVAGAYAIHCSGLSSSSYTITWADGTLTVNPAPVAVTASSPPTQTHGATFAPSITCSATGFVGADSFITNPTGAVYDASGTDQVSIGSTASAGDYVTKCTGGDPGSNYTISGYTPGTFTVQDTTAPVVTVPASMTLEATDPAGATATFSATASDAVDGPSGATCVPASGSTFAIATTTVTCSATDAAGNTGSASFTVMVKSASTQLTDLQAKVQSLPLDPTPRKNLQSILQNAQAAADKGNIPAACDKLTSFVSQVQALSGKKVATPDADGLLVDARRIMAVLGCS